MNSSNRHITAILLLMLAVTGGLHAQQKLVTSPQAITIVGGDCSNDYGSVSTSGGEMAVRTSEARAINVVNITASISEGVQQPLLKLDRQLDITTPVCNLSVYPNPTTDGVTLEGEGIPLRYTLYTLAGQPLKEGDFDGSTTRVSLESYASGCYLLQVTSHDRKQTSIYRITLTK